MERRPLAWRFAAFMLTAVVLTAPYILFVAPRIARDTQPRPLFSDVNLWNADLLAFFAPSPTHPWWGSTVAPLYARFTGNVFEQTVYVGWVALVLAAVAVARRRQARFWAWTGLVFTVLALGPLLHVAGMWRFDVGGLPVTVPLPAIVLHFLPGVSALRVMSRFSVMTMLVLAALVGFALAALRDRLQTARPRPRAAGAIAVVIGLAILVDYLSVPLPVLSTRIPRALQALGAERGSAPRGSLVDVPLDWRVAKYEYYQTAHGKPLLVGLVPRPAPVVLRQLDGVPFVSFFQDPGRHAPSAAWDPLCTATPCSSFACASDGPGRSRTCDLGIKSPLLYQLSYRPRQSSIGTRARRSGRRTARVDGVAGCANARDSAVCFGVLGIALATPVASGMYATAGARARRVGSKGWAIPAVWSVVARRFLKMVRGAVGGVTAPPAASLAPADPHRNPWFALESCVGPRDGWRPAPSPRLVVSGFAAYAVSAALWAPS